MRRAATRFWHANEELYSNASFNAVYINLEFVFLLHLELESCCLGRCKELLKDFPSPCAIISVRGAYENMFHIFHLSFSALYADVYALLVFLSINHSFIIICIVFILGSSRVYFLLWYLVISRILPFLPPPISTTKELTPPLFLMDYYFIQSSLLSLL